MALPCRSGQSGPCGPLDHATPCPARPDPTGYFGRTNENTPPPKCLNPKGDERCEHEPEPAFETPAEWAPWLQTIRQNVRHHINPPAALGSGHRALSDKAAAEAYKWSLQEAFGNKLRCHAESFVSYTTDMGVELGLADFAVNDLEGLLPRWVHRVGLQPDVFMAEGGADAQVFIASQTDSAGPAPPPSMHLLS